VLTQSHIAIGLLLAAKSGRRAAITGAILGGIAPDFSMVPMMLVSYFLLGQDMEQIWSLTFYSAPWWTIDQITNSAPLYAVIAAVSAFAMRGNAHWLPRFTLAFSLTALLHVGFDFLTHATDGHIHFWPLTDFVFASPVSYWESDHHGRLFGLIEALAGLAAVVVLWRMYSGWVVRTFCGILAVMSVLGLVLSTVLTLGFGR